MNIAIIPARGGSKRIPRKNIKEFCGKPMISYAIEAALKSGLFEHVIVSTDDLEIAAIARSLGASTPFMRPIELADDYTTTAPVILNAIQNCLSLGLKFDKVCTIYPAVPLISSCDLIASLELLNANQGDFCFAVAKYASPIQRALRSLPNKKMEPLYAQYEFSRTQDLELSYYDAGQFIWGKKKAWLDGMNVHSGGLGYELPSWRAVDVDTIEDWRHAEIVASGVLGS